MLTLGIVGGIAVDLQKRYVYPDNIQDVYDGPDHIWPDRYVFEFDGHSGQVFDEGNGGTYTVPLISTKNNKFWEYSHVESGDHDWFTVTTSGSTVTIVVDEGEDPSYIFKYQSTDQTNISKTALQTGSTYTETIISQTAGTAVEVPFTHSSNVNWITVSDNGDDVTITVAENSTTESRSGKVTFTQHSSGLTLTYTITQPGKEPEPVEPEEPVYVFKWTGIPSGTFNVSVQQTGATTTSVSGLISTKDGNFQKYTVSGAPSWFHLTTSDTSTTMSYTADANTSEQARTATITLTQNESNLKLYIKITQDGKEHVPVYVFTWGDHTETQREVSVESESVTKTETVISTKDGEKHEYSITNKPDWIEVTKTTDGISYTIKENTETE